MMLSVYTEHCYLADKAALCILVHSCHFGEPLRNFCRDRGKRCDAIDRSPTMLLLICY